MTGSPTHPRPRLPARGAARGLGWVGVLLVLAVTSAPASAQDTQDNAPAPASAGPGEDAPPAESAPSTAPLDTPSNAPAAHNAPEDLPPPATPPADPFISSLGPGTGPGLPWQVVLLVQLLAYAAADLVPYLGCVAGSWVLSVVVALGAAAGLPFAILLSLLLVPPAAVLSGCGSAALLQWLGDRLGVQRGRLAVVGLSSVVLSFVTYALVIFPIIVGMGFFSVAAYSFLSASALLVLPQLNLPSLPWWISAAGYSVSAAGLVAALVFVAAGAVLAPLVGFFIRPPLVALAYRLAGRDREPGEEQWPPSLFGERADLLPWPFRTRRPVQAPGGPAATAPSAAENPAPPPAETPGAASPPVESPPAETTPEPAPTP